VIVTDRGDSAEEVVYRERIDAVHLDSEHSRAQLAERLAWAIGDAQTSDGQGGGKQRAGAGARSRAGFE
jgi:hypothetical protein